MRTSDIVRQLWCEFYSGHCEGWLGFLVRGEQDLCSAVKNRRDVQTGKTRPCLTGAGATTEVCLCKAGKVCGRGLVVGLGPRWDAVEGKGKKFGALGCRKPEFVRPRKQASCYPKFLAIY